MTKETQTPLPKPPVPTGVDLHDFSFVPIFRGQLFRSTFHGRASDAEWRAGVTLWLKSWDQIPAGSLPDDDIELCRLADFGRNIRGWKKVRGMALRGWYVCDDFRLYHKIVSEGVMAAWMRRIAASNKGKSGASKRWALIEGGLGNGAGMPQPLQQPLPIDGTGIDQLMPGDSNLILDSRDKIPTQTLPAEQEGLSLRDRGLNPRAKGTNPRASGSNPRATGENPRASDKAEKDEAVAAWIALLASKGAKRDVRVQAAIDAAGGWARIAGRKQGAEDSIVRNAFCDAYRSAPP